MKTITTPHATLAEWIEQMRSLGIQRNNSVQIRYNGIQAIALFYTKGQLSDSRRLYRL